MLLQILKSLLLWEKLSKALLEWNFALSPQKGLDLVREVSRVVGYNLAAFSKNPDYLSDPALLSHTHTLPQRRGDFGPSQDCVTEEVENFQQPTIVIGVFRWTLCRFPSHKVFSMYAQSGLDFLASIDSDYLEQTCMWELNSNLQIRPREPSKLEGRIMLIASFYPLI